MRMSIVIPAFNEERYIGNCLNAALKEIESNNYDIEIIVVDNASADKTAKIASGYPGVKVVREDKKGLVNARRAGYMASTGDIIANVDADTIMPKGWVKKVFSEFNGDKELAALSGPFVLYDQGGIMNWLVRLFYGVGFVAYVINRHLLSVGSMLQGGNYIFKRSAFEKIGGYNSNGFNFYGEDADLARRLHQVGKVKFTFDLMMPASGRRLQAEGVLKSGIKYSINYLWSIFFKRPYHKEHADIRN